MFGAAGGWRGGRHSLRRWGPLPVFFFPFELLGRGGQLAVTPATPEAAARKAPRGCGRRGACHPPPSPPPPLRRGGGEIVRHCRPACPRAYSKSTRQRGRNRVAALGIAGALVRARSGPVSGRRNGRRLRHRGKNKQNTTRISECRRAAVRRAAQGVPPLSFHRLHHGGAGTAEYPARAARLLQPWMRQAFTSTHGRG